MKTTAEKIRYYREQNKISQESLSELSKISTSAIRKYESGVLVPGEEHITRIATALHISPAALKEAQLDYNLDVFPILFDIGQKMGIEFKSSGSKLYYRFNNEDLDGFFHQWLTEQEAINNANTIMSEQDSEEIRSAVSRAKESLEDGLEKKLVLDRVQKRFYSDFDLEKKYSLKSIRKKYNLSSLKNYSTFYNCLVDLTRTCIGNDFETDFDCVGIYGRLWIPKTILTFRADSISPDNMSFYSEEIFLKFVYYLNEFHKLGADVESYSFSQEGVEYYRFVLVDKTIASNLETIKELKNLLENPKHTVNEQKIVESKIKDILRELDKPISIYQHK